jgi:hypothetical protein
VSRHLTKENIRAALVKRGRYDLTSNVDRVRLRRRVDGTWRWLQAPLSYVDPSLRSLGPKTILEKVSFKNRQRLAFNVKDIREKLGSFENVLFFGTGALTAAIAFGLQWCHEKPASAHHMTVADIDTDSKYQGLRTLGTSRGDLLVLELYPDGEGKVWVEVQKRLVAALRSHTGPIILVLRGDYQGPRGQLCKIVVDCLKPSARYPIGRKR